MQQRIPESDSFYESPLLSIATFIRGSGTEGDLVGPGVGRALWMQLLIVVVVAFHRCRSVKRRATFAIYFYVRSELPTTIILKEFNVTP